LEADILPLSYWGSLWGTSQVGMFFEVVMPVSVLARDENSLLGLGSKCGRLNSVVVQGIPSRCGDPTVM